MIRFGVLLNRLFERRFLRDGASDASLLPGALTTLAISSLVASLVVPELTPVAVARIVVLAVFAWSFLRSALENRELEDEDLDDRILAPLPIRPSRLLLARAIVVGVGIVVDALNVALPAAVWMAARGSLMAGVMLVVVALLSALFGLALASALRSLAKRLVPARALARFEGPLQLGAALLVLALVIRAPHLDLSSLLSPPLRYLPPLSYAAVFFDGGERSDGLAAAFGVVASLLLLGLSITGRALRTRAATTHRGNVARDVGILERLARKTISNPTEAAGFLFAIAQMRSDRVFRSRSYPLFVFPFAAIVLAGSDATDASLVPMAFFGATVYLVLAEVFFGFSESATGPGLLRTLPIGDVAAFRIGAEKAFLARLVAPVHIALGFGALALDVVRRDAASFGQHFLLAIAAMLTSMAIVLITFEKEMGLPFGTTDRALYSSDLTSGAYGALLIATIAALITIAALPHPFVVLVQLGVLVLMIGQTLRWKRTRKHRIPT